MFEILFRDIVYIAKTVREQFQIMTALKLTILPTITGAIGYIGEKFGLFVIPSWAWFMVGIIMAEAIILIIIARKMRKHEEPIFKISFDEAGKSFLLHIDKKADNEKYIQGIRLRVLPQATAYAYCGAILNSVYYKYGDDWLPTSLNESFNLLWSNVSCIRENIYPERRQFLDILEIWETGDVRPCVDILAPHAEGAFEREGKYRLEIIMETGSRKDIRFYIFVDVYKDLGRISACLELGESFNTLDR